MTVDAATVRDTIRGFYAVLDRDDPVLADQLIASGARVLQVRIKPPDPLATGELMRIARWAKARTDAAGVALVVNDRLDVALAIGAHGVHLGQQDLPISDARRISGGRLWIGVSTHDPAQVRAAVSGGADYLGFGPVFETRTKANPDPVQGLAGLRGAVRVAAGVPIVAIGGISPATAHAVYGAGAAAACAIGAVNDAPDVSAAGRALGTIR